MNSGTHQKQLILFFCKIFPCYFVTIKSNSYPFCYSPPQNSEKSLIMFLFIPSSVVTHNKDWIPQDCLRMHTVASDFVLLLGLYAGKSYFIVICFMTKFSNSPPPFAFLSICQLVRREQICTGGITLLSISMPVVFL